MSDYTPTSAQVAAHVRARLKEPGGFEVEDFTENTRPTKAQVDTLAAQGNRAVSSRVGSELCQAAVDAGLEDSGKELAAIYVAMVIEQSFYPEQSRAQGSSFDALYRLWKDGITAYTEQVGETCGTGDGEAVGGEGASPRSFFDDNALIGRNYPAW